MTALLFSLLCLVVAWTPHPDLGFFEHGLQFEKQVNDKFWIAWEISESNNTLFLALAVQTSGWIGFGPTHTGSMIGANPCVVREQPVGSGNFSAFAYHSMTMSEPILNEVQNCELLWFNQANNETYAKIQRPIVGCRPEDMDISTVWIMRWIAAWGDTQAFEYHGIENRFTVEMDPRFPIPDPPAIPPGSMSFDAVLGEPWSLLDDRDVYMCRGIHLPQDKRYHVFQVDPLLYEIAPATYHHVIMYECPDGIPREWEDGVMDECPYVGGTLGCTRFWMGWAIGQTSLRVERPLAMGAGDGAVRDIFLETHIDNPTYNTSIVDPGWGFRLWYTDELYEVESAIMGLYVGITLAGIPAGSESYSIEGYCAPGCTRNLPTSGIWIDSVSPHLHAAGISAWVTHVRDGKEIGEIFRMDAWDANWQGPRWRSLDTHVNVLPGDVLIGTCVYNTEDRTRRTFFGEGYNDEMCMFYISYYPRTDLVTCTEWPGRGDGWPRERLGTVSFCSWRPWVAYEHNRDFTPVEKPPSNCSPRKENFFLEN